MVSKKKVYIITDGSKEIGMGHIARCLSFYDRFTEEGFDTEMLIDSEHTGIDLLGQRKYELINWHSDITRLDFATDNILFLDSLAASQEQCDYIRRLAGYFVVIDDFRRRQYEQSLIIDWTPDIENTEKHIHNMGHGNCLFLGLTYSVLRKPFICSSLYRIRDLKVITVVMGGSDIRNLTFPLVSAIRTFLPDIEINAVFGSGVKDFPATAGVRYLNSLDAEAMRNLFLGSDLVVSAGGQTLFELAALQIPVIPIQVAGNQTEDLTGLQSLGFFDEVFQWDDVCLTSKVVDKIRKLRSINARLEYLKCFRISGIGCGLDKIMNHIKEVIS